MENELVKIKRNEILCDSRVLAEKFGKQHQHIIQKLDKLISNLAILDSEKLLTENKHKTEIFKEKTHSYRGQSFRYFEMNKPAFSLFVMGFTGQKALKWKRIFNDAFYQMEQSLLRQSNLEWQGTREQGKQIHISLTDEVKTFIEYAKNQGANEKGANMYYSNITKMEYKALGLIEKNEKISKDFRNTLDSMDLHNLLAAENVARKALMDGMQQELHYKDIFQLAKNNVTQLADIMVIKFIEDK